MTSGISPQTLEFVVAVEEIAAQEVSATVPALAADVIEALGRRIALGICARYARTQLYVPAAVALLHNGPRNLEIWQAYHQDGPDGARAYSGARVNQIARQHRLTARQVQSIIKRLRDRDIADWQAARSPSGGRKKAGASQAQ